MTTTSPGRAGVSPGADGETVIDVSGLRRTAGVPAVQPLLSHQAMLSTSPVTVNRLTRVAAYR